MTTLDATVPAAAAPALPTRGGARFVGKTADFVRLLIRGSLFVLVTLGIYRFWLTTDIRRFLWSNTELAGESFEYTGTARELLLGFLFAIAVLVPINAALFAATLDLGLIGELSSVIAFVLLAVLGQFALYRARRYRLTRTVYRGVRFHQSGSGWHYAMLALLWWLVIALTLGLAYPFAQAQLERFKTRHTFYGNLRGRFDGSGLRLLLRGFVMWALVIGPLLVTLAVMAAEINWAQVAASADTFETDTDPELLEILVTLIPGFIPKMMVLGGVLAWSIVAALIFYPVFQAMLLRWWASGLRFGELSVTSRLRTGAVYGAYARFIGLTMAFSMVLGTLLAMVMGLVSVTLNVRIPLLGQVTQVAIGIASYLVLLLGYSVINQVVVKLAIWRLVVESLDITGLAALDRVTAEGQPSSAFGEGLADALGAGGL
jgi:uncharacterized membrane protein YjgN (DUF898 family)